MAKINFSTFLLYVNDTFATSDFCKKISDSNNKNGIKEYQKIPYEFYTKFDDNDNTLWIEIKTGNAYPYDDTVFDTRLKKKFPNPRNPDQAELRRQIFCLYNCNNKTLYVSNKNFILIICWYFRQQSGIDNIFTSEMIKSVDEFCSEIAKIKSIRLISKNTLFSQTDELFKTPSDTFGLGNPKQYEINVTYDYVKVTEKFKSKVKDLFIKRQSTQIDSFLCVGKDTNNLERYFNMETFGQKIQLEIEQNDKHMFSGIAVKMELIANIRNSLGMKDV